MGPAEIERYAPWVLAASVGLHVALVAALPSLRAHVAPIETRIEMTLAPPDPPAPSPPPEPTPTSAPAAPRVAPLAPSRAPPTRPAPANDPPPTSTPPSDAPVDFADTLLSNADGPGLAVAAGEPSLTSVPVAAASRPAAPSPPPAGPRFAPLADLARAPSAPALDDALARNYPLEARRAGVSGRAVLRVDILPDGRIGAVQRMNESFEGFAAACERTVRSGRWGAPLDRDGQPVATRITYTCRFEVGS
jgi:protein TonB